MEPRPGLGDGELKPFGRRAIASASATDHAGRKRKRAINVYDAVAGRVNTKGPLNPVDGDPYADASARKPSASRGKYTRRDATLPPEEVLFQRAGAPRRYEEADVYFANERDLPEAGRDVLPDADLLKAVHGYASRFYEALGRRKGQDPGSGRGRDESVAAGDSRRPRRRRLVDERSMDETALLAFGILLEEAGREVLGRRGDLVFTEGVIEDSGGSGGAEGLQGFEAEKPVAATTAVATRTTTTIGFGDGEAFWKRKIAKRRKLDS